MINYFALFIFATLYTLIFEYIAHKYILHNYKYFKTAFKNHFKIHHGTSRKNKMYDMGYETIISSYFEIISLVIIGIIHIPIIFLSTFFYLSLIFNMSHYYYVHRRSHINVEWGKKNIPWHYAHHMGKDQNINWGVRSPIIDKFMGTSNY